jgi:hypothetical protein
MDGWMDRWMNGWMGGWIAPIIHSITIYNELLSKINVMSCENIS